MLPVLSGYFSCVDDARYSCHRRYPDRPDGPEAMLSRKLLERSVLVFNAGAETIYCILYLVEIYKVVGDFTRRRELLNPCHLTTDTSNTERAANEGEKRILYLTLTTVSSLGIILYFCKQGRNPSHRAGSGEAKGYGA